jgi:hypothetical protein
LAHQLQVAAGEVTETISEETKEVFKEAEKQKDKVNYIAIVEHEVSAQPWLSLITAPASKINQLFNNNLI